jgi:hypothetical protein
VSASARGTTANYSKGEAIGRGRSQARRRVLAAVALAGAALLLVAEPSPLYTVVVGSLDTPRRSVSAGSNHGYALALVALAAVAMAAGALRGARAAAVALIVLGAAALFVALAIDRPDTRQSGTLRESLAYSEAHARPARGYRLELTGAVLLVVAGTGLLALGRPRPRGPRSRSSRPAAAQG